MDFVSMELTPQEIKEESGQIASYPVNKFPYGLCISFTEEELEKLDLADDCCPGDHVILHCLAKVTSVSKNDTTEGMRMRVEMQIIAIAADDDDEEDEAPAPRRKIGPDSLYK